MLLMLSFFFFSCELWVLDLTFVPFLPSQPRDLFSILDCAKFLPFTLENMKLSLFVQLRNPFCLLSGINSKFHEFIGINL